MCAHPVLLLPATSPALPPYHFLTTEMVCTRGGSCLRPQVRFITPEQEEHALASVAVPEEPQGFRRYQTRMGPWAPSPVPQRRSKRARPSKRARTSGTGGVIVIQASTITVPVSSRGAHRPIFRLLHGSDDPFLLGPRYPGTSIYAPETFMESHTTTCRH